MSKIIFLDIDGVLNVYCQDRDEFGCKFHKHFEDNLRWIINETGAKIVISSSWRHDGINKMRHMWKYRKLPGEIIDITPNVTDVVKSGVCEFYDQVDRGHEIQLWIDNYKEKITSYCIIDDDNDMLEHQRVNFVRTANNTSHEDCVDIGYGLTKICSRKVIDILNKKR